MAMSDKIESFITALLREDTSEWSEFGRNELAELFNCVPSQINYVLATRFSPEKGYIVESRRGGGGYVRIRREADTISFDIKEILSGIGAEITEEKAEKIIAYLFETKRIDKTTKSVMEAGLLGGAIPSPALRAEILKRMIKSIL